MAVLIVLSALSMAWFFSANTVALDGLNGLPDNVKTIVNDSQLFIGGFQLEFVSISRVIDHMTQYESECSHWCKIFFKKILYKICSSV